MIIAFAKKNYTIIEKTITKTHLSLFKRWNTLRNMKLIIPEGHYEATKKRYKKESWSVFLTFVPIAMVVVLLLGYLNDQYPIILMPIIFVFTLIAF